MAVGYVDADKNVLGWINELAFAPVDLQEGAMQNEWSLAFGNCNSKRSVSGMAQVIAVW